MLPLRFLEFLNFSVLGLGLGLPMMVKKSQLAKNVMVLFAQNYCSHQLE